MEMSAFAARLAAVGATIKAELDALVGFAPAKARSGPCRGRRGACPPYQHRT
jgi:hypothetical protein